MAGAKKKILLVWDLDGPIGQINSTFPYNFHFSGFSRELDNVKYVLDKLDEYQIKSCFAITGFSAEEGVYPYVFPDLIKEISSRGHEIASHSWRHEWTPIFMPEQIRLSLLRSKSALEKCISAKQDVVGFVPPHNRPMTWVRKGAFSFGDRGIYPFFKMGDNSKLFDQLKSSGYRWVRITHQNLLQKLGAAYWNTTGRVYEYRGLLILENHYPGFDQSVISHILNTDFPTYTISAHPLMLSLRHKSESKENFELFLEALGSRTDVIEFVTPMGYCPRPAT